MVSILDGQDNMLLFTAMKRGVEPRCHHLHTEGERPLQKETTEVFHAVKQSKGKRGGRGRTPEMQAVYEMEIGDVGRFVKHSHPAKTGAHKYECNLVQRIRTGMYLKGRKVSIKHDGEDLLVMRVA